MVSPFSDSDEEVTASTSRSTTSRGRKVSYKMAIDSDDNSDNVPMFDDEDSGSDFEIEPPIKRVLHQKRPLLNLEPNLLRNRELLKRQRRQSPVLQTL